jgi:hypothetical protein
MPHNMNAANHPVSAPQSDTTAGRGCRRSVWTKFLEVLLRALSVAVM